MARSNLEIYAFLWEKMETEDFSETIAASDLKGRRSRHPIEFTKVCEGQCHFSTIYFPGFVCFVLYWAKISGERLLDHWSSGFIFHVLVKKKLPKKAVEKGLL